MFWSRWSRAGLRNYVQRAGKGPGLQSLFVSGARLTFCTHNGSAQGTTAILDLIKLLDSIPMLLAVLLYAELRRSQLNPLQPERGVTGGVIMELNKRGRKQICCVAA